MGWTDNPHFDWSRYLPSAVALNQGSHDRYCSHSLSRVVSHNPLFKLGHFLDRTSFCFISSPTCSWNTSSIAYQALLDCIMALSCLPSQRAQDSRTWRRGSTSSTPRFHVLRSWIIILLRLLFWRCILQFIRSQRQSCPRVKLVSRPSS